MFTIEFILLLLKEFIYCFNTLRYKLIILFFGTGKIFFGQAGFILERALVPMAQKIILVQEIFDRRDDLAHIFFQSKGALPVLFTQ